MIRSPSVKSEPKDVVIASRQPRYTPAYEPAVFNATLLKVLLALEPRAVMALMHTTTIRANITAYSTAVGPSSRWRNFRTACWKLRMDTNPFRFAGRRWTGPDQASPLIQGSMFVPTGTAEMERKLPAVCGGAQRSFPSLRRPGDPACSVGPMALRHRLTTVLPLSRMKRSNRNHLFRTRRGTGRGSDFRVHPSNRFTNKS